jgi:hypothetical protein
VLIGFLPPVLRSSTLEIEDTLFARADLVFSDSSSPLQNKPLTSTHIHGHGVKSLTDGSRALFYGKNDPFRSWPISANELEEVAMGSETNV